ncbi:hypothetical protein LEMLEM_LOCUS18997, partial [Lemmus lemmus]
MGSELAIVAEDTHSGLLTTACNSSLRRSVPFSPIPGTKTQATVP